MIPPHVPRAEHERRVSELLAANNDLLARARAAEAETAMLARETGLTPEAADALHAAICDRVFFAMGVGDRIRPTNGATLAQLLAAVAVKRGENDLLREGGKVIHVIPTDAQVAAAYLLECASRSSGPLAAAPHPTNPKQILCVAVVPARTP